MTQPDKGCRSICASFSGAKEKFHEEMLEGVTSNCARMINSARKCMLLNFEVGSYVMIALVRKLPGSAKAGKHVNMTLEGGVCSEGATRVQC